MKSVVVTGASKGLGLAIVEKLLNSGYKVIGISRSKGDDLANLQEKYSGRVAFYNYDFSNVEGISALVKIIVKEHGRPYGLINNAAVGHDGVLATMHESDILSVITTNVTSPILLTKYISRSMLLNQAGRIINIGSIIGTTGFNGLSVYGASKSALNGFTKSLAREVGKANITVNTLAPGYMQTSMTESLQGEKLSSIVRRSPLGRLADVNDAADAVLFLLSDGAKSVTGTTITVDAGSTA
jgi:3-oxoacyl-[acyl-carrier protein] reductase